MNTTSTGNGFKSGYASSVGIYPTNFYIQPSVVSYDELIETMDCGLIIDEINGSIDIERDDTVIDEVLSIYQTLIGEGQEEK